MHYTHIACLLAVNVTELNKTDRKRAEFVPDFIGYRLWSISSQILAVKKQPLLLFVVPAFTHEMGC